MNAHEVLENYLQLTPSHVSWLYLNPERIWGRFLTTVGAVAEFEIGSSEGTSASGNLAFFGTGAGGSRSYGDTASVRYQIGDDPLLQALLVRARLSQQRALRSPCDATAGELVDFVARGQPSHPDLAYSGDVLSSYYEPTMAIDIEGARMKQEARAQFGGLDPDARYVAVAFRHAACPVASVLGLRLMHRNWVTSYGNGVGYLGVFGEIEPSPLSDVKLVAPLHIWWQEST